ncbi:MAG: HAD family phosphatase [Phycisphaerales bacterium]|nr:HAD family phosphatase [Phycisphaerales bacterium]
MDQFGAIFDLDGTLVDSCTCHERAWMAVGDSVGIPVTREFFLRFFGRPNTPIIEALFGEAGRATPDAPTIARLADQKESIFRTLLGGTFPIMPGTHQLLDALHDDDWLVAIGSSAPPVNVDFMLRGIAPRHAFDAIVTGDCVAKGKPHPDVFLEAASRLELAPNECVVIEDALPGIEAAHRAGMHCVALCSAGHTREELAAADLIVHHLDELSPSRLQSLIYL